MVMKVKVEGYGSRLTCIPASFLVGMNPENRTRMPLEPQTKTRKETDMFFELRQYRMRPGQREKWVQCMEKEIIPFQVAQGMVILGSFVGQEEEDLYVWIRRFESEEERKRLYEAVYESDYWKNDIAPRVPEMIDRDAIKVVRIEATPKSVIQ
jgi:hypothetical protein